MSTSSNTTIVVQYDLYKTTMNYSISINKPNIIHNIIHNIKFTNSPTLTQRKNTQTKQIIIVNDNNINMSIYWWIFALIVFYLINFFIIY
jgi:hypothetical protein